MHHPFRYHSLSKPKTVLTAPREAPQLGSKGFSIRQRSQWTTDMGDSGAPPSPQGRGGGASKGGERSSKFARTVPRAKSCNRTTLTGGTTKDGRDDRSGMGAHAAATVHQHGAHRLRRRNSHHRTNATRNCSSRRNTKNTSMRDELVVARGYATGVRADGITTGSALWAELVQRDEHCRHALSRTWGLVHSTESTKMVFFDVYEGQPAARAAPPIDTAAKKYGVAPTTLNQLLVWARAAAGPTDPPQETQSIATARKTHRELAHTE